MNTDKLINKFKKKILNINISTKIAFASCFLFLVGISTETLSSEKINFQIDSKSLISNLLEEDLKIQTVTANGFGISIESASQNAAENALTQVVGSFIDSETLIKKGTEIKEGVISKTKLIKKDIKNYSQGSIKYFEILNIQENGPIFNITARVDVRIEDFRSYIKELASDTKEIDSGLFASIKTDEENIENKLDLLGKLLDPLIKAEVTKISIGEAQRLNNLSAFNCKYIYDRKRISCPKGNKYSREGAYDMSPKGSIVIPITFNLDKDFKNNSMNILQNISNQKTSSLLENNKSPFNFKNFDPNNDYVISLFNSANNVLTSYLISDAREYNSERIKNKLREFIPVNATQYCSNYLPKIKLSLLDKSKQSIWEKKFQNCYGRELTYKDSQVKVELFYVSPDQNNGFIEPIYQNLYSFLKMSYGKFADYVIFEQSPLLLIIEPEENFLNTISEIKVEYVTN